MKKFFYFALALLVSMSFWSCNLLSGTKSSNANLIAITLSSGELSPAFSADTTNYTVALDNSVTSVTVTGIADDGKATVSSAVTLSNLVVGTPQTATISVVAADGSKTKVYTIKVTRQIDAATAAAIAANKAKMAGLTQPASLTTSAASSMDDTVESTTPEADQTALDSTGAPVTYKITTTKYKAAATYDTNVLLNPSTDVIYPGSVLLGESIDDGSYTEIVSGTKRPVTISFDLSGVKDSSGNAGVVSGSIVPSLSSYRGLKNKILAQSVPKQTSTYSMEKTEIHSEEEMNLKVNAGASFSGGIYEASIKAGFSYDKSNTTNKLMIKFMQTFYTVDVDQGSGTFLYDDFDVSAFHGYRPVYVSSIAYGRLAYLTIESTQSITDIEANLDAAFKAGGTSADVSVSNAQKMAQVEHYDEHHGHRRIDRSDRPR